MDQVIHALEHSLAHTSDTALRAQLTAAISLLRGRRQQGKARRPRHVPRGEEGHRVLHEKPPIKLS